MAEVMQYFVVNDGAWKIDFKGKKFGPYPTQASAISAATDAAYDMGFRGGQNAQVLAQDEGDEFHVKWSYGDPYTPPE